MPGLDLGLYIAAEIAKARDQRRLDSREHAFRGARPASLTPAQAPSNRSSSAGSAGLAQWA